MTEHYQQHDTETMTRNNYAVKLFLEGGTVRLRLKERITRKTLLDENLEKLKILIPENHPQTKTFEERNK